MLDNACARMAQYMLFSRILPLLSACKVHPREQIVELPSAHMAANGDDFAHALAFEATVWGVLDIPHSVDIVTLPDAEQQAFRKACDPSANGEGSRSTLSIAQYCTPTLTNSQ
eukprot:TRINITY_DN12308_c2_g6_i1.p1 TRINITY_DN12308_c2_g6~~TRINITY_DN12308_c2_g6_i1.p1  ORF type:complete len:113 (+),score=21.87 TRINITY_DN12308_c2_g6_i1:127-465(+)